MFNFMKRNSDKEGKDGRKRDKRDKRDRKSKGPLTTQEELDRLEIAKRGLLSDSNGRGGGAAGGYSDGMAVAYREPTPTQQMHQRDSSHSLSSDSGSMLQQNNGSSNYTSYKQVHLSKPQKPQTQALQRPKRGILKGQSHYGPVIPNQGVSGNLDDTQVLEQNTLVNELTSGELPGKKSDQPDSGASAAIETESIQDVRSAIATFEAESRQKQQKQRRSGGAGGSSRSYKYQHPRQPPPPVPTATNRPATTTNIIPATATTTATAAYSNGVSSNATLNANVSPLHTDKSFDGTELHLPQVSPPRCPPPREVTLKRLVSGDFGFTLRRGTVLERSLIENGGEEGGADQLERSRTVVFAEPGSKRELVGGLLLPGDRLLAVNDVNVESSTREEVIDLVRRSGDTVKLRVQPIPELSELRARSDEAGTLKRQPIKTRTDTQLASDAEWAANERVWLVHKGGFSGGYRINTTGGGGDGSGGKVTVKLDFNGKELTVEEEDVEKANPPQYDRAEDITSLRHLNESGCLHTMRQRYGSNLIHTYAGPTTLVINPMHPLSIYTEKVMSMFRGCKSEEMPPHIYSVTQTAYRTLLATRQDQSLVLIGRSGSGKSSNLKHALQYLVYTAGCVHNGLTVEKLSCVFTLLEAFGNSRTLMNTTATRFTQLFTLDFDSTGQIVGASIQVLMLEKSRVVRRPEGEPSFHVFYQMLAGLNQKQRSELLLQNLSEPNMFMTPLQRTEDREKAAKCWNNIEAALAILGITEEEQLAVCKVLAAIYHLGGAGVSKVSGTRYQFAHPSAAQRAAQLLGTSMEELIRVVFVTDTTPYRSAYRSPLSANKQPTQSDSTFTGIECLEGFVIGLYTEVFNILISLINRSLSSNYRCVASLVLLDAPGFQSPQSCGRHSGASLQDLCHNYMHERLQLLYHDKVFVQLQDLYTQEGIDIEFDVTPASPAAMVHLIDQPPQQNIVRSDVEDSDDRGLLWMLDEESLYPGATDHSFVQRLLHTHGSQGERYLPLLQRTDDECSFLLQHYHGTCPIVYNAAGWLKAAKECHTVKCAAAFLQDSSCAHISSLFSTHRGVSSTLTGSVVGLEGSTSLRRSASLRRSYTTGAASLKRKSTCLQYKFQVDSLIDTLRRTRTHFIHCMLPQNNAGLCDLKSGQRSTSGKPTANEDVVLNVPLLRQQVRGHSIVEAVRVYRQGYPEHMLYIDFYRRYSSLVTTALPYVQGANNDERKIIGKLVEDLEIDAKAFKLGSSQVFFRAGILASLDEKRDGLLGSVIVKLQSVGRGYLARKKLKQLKVQQLAVRCIQRNVSKYLQVRDWPWWRLYTKIRPLLNVQRTEEQIRDQELELERLRSKVEKLEREKNEYKITAERLDTKVSEMTADLAEEHTSTTQASDLLEVETANRIRCEKELRQLQTRYEMLEREHDRTETELIHTQMLLSQQEDEEDDEGEDSVYKQKYERLRKEVEFAKKTADQEHQEELDRITAAKKLSDKKLSDATIELEEQSKLVSNLKKKVQRLATESQDLQLHAQSEATRNTQLEKKQRKFDSELHKVTEHLKEEKQMREKLQREKDEAIAASYQAQQDLKSVQVDYELIQEKLARLEADMSDMGSGEGKDDQQVVTLKRQKAELELRIQDQEEELDEQATQIHTLEQTKLRLEMSQEKLRQQHMTDNEERDLELEQVKANSQKKVRVLEGQIEDDYNERQKVIKEKRELERKLQQMADEERERDKSIERKLRRDLKRTKALLADCQQQLDHLKSSNSKNTVKQLKNQLDELECARSAAVKVRKNLELENTELSEQLDDVMRAKQEAEDKLSAVCKEKSDLTSKLEEDEEDLAEITKKYNAAVKQQSVDHITIQSQSQQIEELTKECQTLKEQVNTLQSTVDYQNTTTIDKESQVRLQTRIRELESQLELANTTKHQAEVKVGRLRDQLEQLSEERDKLTNQDSEMSDKYKSSQRLLREAREDVEEAKRKETDATHKYRELEVQYTTLETEHRQCQVDLKIAFKRITDLQNVLEDDLDDDDDDDDDDVGDSDSSDTSDDYHHQQHHRYHNPRRHHSAGRISNHSDLPTDEDDDDDDLSEADARTTSSRASSGNGR